MIALITGNTIIRKPSHKAVLSAIAVTKIASAVLARNDLPQGTLNLVIGNRKQVGDPLVNDPRVPLISATGSVNMGKLINQSVAGRLGKAILELGGNNAIIVTPTPI